MSTPKQWNEMMGEISGMGGAYEAMCRKMVRDGRLIWTSETPAK